VWNIEYRRVGDAGGGWPGSFEDIRAALTLLAQERPPGVDLRRLLIAGHSAGGHLALLAGSSQLTAPLTGLGLRGVVGLAAITDIATYTRGEGSCQAAAARFMGGSPGERPAAYRLANPAGLPVFSPTTLMLGTSDRIVPRAQGRLEGAQIQWLEAGHFDWIHPGTPAWLSFMRLLEALAE
jgi:acetyl esterase/lipase